MTYRIKRFAARSLFHAPGGLRAVAYFVKDFGSQIMRKARHRQVGLFVFGFLMAVGLVRAQAAAPAKIPSGGSPPSHPSLPRIASGPHKFWDAENGALFAGVAVTRALDFTTTQHFRQRGFNEILLTNGIVDNKPLFAGIEAAGTAASIGVCYLLHRTGHHRAERWVSMVHVGVGVFGDIRNYNLSKP